jgi:hypothetical protein
VAKPRFCAVPWHAAPFGRLGQDLAVSLRLAVPEPIFGIHYGSLVRICLHRRTPITVGRQERSMAGIKSISVFALGLFSLLAISGLDKASAQSNSACLYYRDISSINPVGDNTAIIIDTRRNKYEVTFLSVCQVKQHAEFFVFDRFQLGTCVDQGDVFSSGGAAAPCHVESISLLPE